MRCFTILAFIFVLYGGKPCSGCARHKKARYATEKHGNLEGRSYYNFIEKFYKCPYGYRAGSLGSCHFNLHNPRGYGIRPSYPPPVVHRTPGYGGPFSGKSSYRTYGSYDSIHNKGNRGYGPSTYVDVGNSDSNQNIIVGLDLHSNANSGYGQNGLFDSGDSDNDGGEYSSSESESDEDEGFGYGSVMNDRYKLFGIGPFGNFGVYSRVNSVQYGGRNRYRSGINEDDENKEADNEGGDGGENGEAELVASVVEEGIERGPQFEQEQQIGQGSEFEQEPQFARGQQLGQGSQFEREPEFARGEQLGQGSQFEREPEFAQGEQLGQHSQFEQEPQFAQGQQLGQGSQFEMEPQFARGQQLGQGSQFEGEPQFAQGQQLGQGSHLYQEPQFVQGQQLGQGSQFEREPQFPQGKQLGQGSQFEQESQFAQGEQLGLGLQFQQEPQFAQEHAIPGPVGPDIPINSVFLNMPSIPVLGGDGAPGPIEILPPGLKLKNNNF